MEAWVDVVNDEPKAIYLNEKLAERNKKGTVSCVPVYGYRGGGWTNEIVEGCCVYFNKEMNTVRELINCLYQLEGCACGGIGHVMIDEENYSDEIIKSTIEDCINEPERTESGLVKLIGEKLLSLSLQERAFLFSSYTDCGVCMHPECRDDCPLHKGEKK